MTGMKRFIPLEWLFRPTMDWWRIFKLGESQWAKSLKSKGIEHYQISNLQKESHAKTAGLGSSLQQTLLFYRSCSRDWPSVPLSAWQKIRYYSCLHKERVNTKADWINARIRVHCLEPKVIPCIVLGSPASAVETGDWQMAHSALGESTDRGLSDYSIVNVMVHSACRFGPHIRNTLCLWRVTVKQRLFSWSQFRKPCDARSRRQNWSIKI